MSGSNLRANLEAGLNDLGPLSYKVLPLALGASLFPKARTAVTRLIRTAESCSEKPQRRYT
jgi:hypothetical protein